VPQETWSPLPTQFPPIPPPGAKMRRRGRSKREEKGLVRQRKKPRVRFPKRGTKREEDSDWTEGSEGMTEVIWTLVEVYSRLLDRGHLLLPDRPCHWPVLSNLTRKERPGEIGRRRLPTSHLRTSALRRSTVRRKKAAIFLGPSFLYRVLFCEPPSTVITSAGVWSWRDKLCAAGACKEHP
jgi:hypothetical protein